jgi:predicted ATPase
MIRYLKLERFKNFQEATLPMGPFTVLVGTNASGKSNLRDAFRVVHGLSRGYTIAETLGEKWIEGGVLQWRGIRGGAREAAFHGAQSLALELGFTIQMEELLQEAVYRIEINVGSAIAPPHVQVEQLSVSGQEHPIYTARRERNLLDDAGSLELILEGDAGPMSFYPDDGPALRRIVWDPDFHWPEVKQYARATVQALESMRFLDLSPEAMRIPSLPGQTILGDRGENLSSVLQAICQNESTRSGLVEWIRALTPLDVVDFEFVPDQIGRLLVTLVEQGGRRVSAYSASDGTLRFLAIIAALLGPHPASFYFFEELENGIHPTRLHLLTSLIERKVSQGSIQVVASSHSPQLLGMLDPESLEHASLTYRLEGSPGARIRRILDIPEASRVIREQAPASLHASGWFEDAVAFVEEAAAQPESAR